ncbi:MAG: hypothetical protein AB8G11_13420 [Saprospiraceae bacterium]
MAMLFYTKTVIASHVMGADISYICNGANDYTIELRVYRDCNGITPGTAQTIDLFSSTCGSQTLSVSLLSNSPSIITPLCPSAPDACSSGTGTYGVEEWVYTGNLTNLPICNDWIMSWDLCCRNAAISTIGSPGNADTYVSALLDNTICNSSPQFLTSPTPFVCVGQSAFYSHGVSDPEGDSLVFNLVDCKRSATTSVNYIPPYSGSNPINTLSGFNIDPVSGAITFTPITNQVGIACLQVEEYRNGVKIGEVTRDMQFSILNCSNNLPTATGIDGTNLFEVTICANQSVSFDINSTDIDLPSQSLSMFWNQGISGANFITNGATAPTGTFSWSPTINEIGTHIFTVTVADNACPLIGQASYNYVINVLPPANTLNVSFNSTDVSCNNACDGTATANVSGGGGNYVYLWDNGQITPTATGLCVGTHTVIIAENGGCEDSFTVVINNPPILTVNHTATNVSCHGLNTGSISITASGGIPPYNYSWQHTGANVGTVSNLYAGTYQVTVSDANGCIDIKTIQITEPNNLTTNISTNNVSCNNGNDGSINLIITGGVTPYNIVWDNGAGLSANPNNLSAGTYNVTITDANGCTITDGTIITEPTAMNSSIATVDVKCNGGNDGSASVTVTGGVPPYTYQWSGGAAGNTPSPGNLVVGNYNVTIIDANGCQITNSMTINEPSMLTATFSVVDVLCNGGNNGSIDLSVNGGTAPYTYQWSNGLGTNQDVNGLSANNYSVNITDANNCVITLTITINEPTTLTATSVVTDLTCFNSANGAINLTVSGGTQPYTYLWSDGVSSKDRNSLSSGSYSVTITDANNCQATLSHNVTEPTLLIVAIPIVSDVTCSGFNNGSIDVTATGGTQPYSYTWSNGSSNQNLLNVGAGAYFLTVTDANGCQVTTNTTIAEPANLNVTAVVTQQVDCHGNNNGAIDLTVTGGTIPYVYSWNNGLGSVEDPSNIYANTYMVTVTDANNCQTTTTVTVIEPTPLVSVMTKNDVLCNGTNSGSATVTVSGGTPNYTYLWSTFPAQNGPTATNLAGGTYTVTVTDANGCTTVNTVTLTEPTLLTASLTSTDLSCFGGSDASITVSANGGISPYTYNWSNNLGNGTSVTNLPSGTFCVTITDANNCNQVVCETVTEPSQMTTSIVIDNNVSCSGGSDGQVDLMVNGGTPNYTYFWSIGSFTEDPTTFNAGWHYVTVTDGLGCTTLDSVEVTEPAPLTVAVSTVIDVSCNGNSDGSINLSVSGGTQPFSFSWNNGAVTQNIDNLPAGNYSVTITDAKNCQTNLTVVVTEPIFLAGTISKTNVSCNGGNDGIATFSPTGGTAPYSYVWSTVPPQFSATANNLSAGTYYVTVTDANNCTYNDSIIITEPFLLTGTTSVVQNVSCQGADDGVAEIVPVGGVFPYTYQWSNGDITNVIGNLSQGIYYVTVTDANGCTFTNNITITAPLLLNMTLVSKTDVSCNGGNDGEIQLNVTGGTLPSNGYIFTWNPPLGNIQSPTGLSAGVYGVTVTDDNGCQDDLSVTINEPTALQLNYTTTNILCNGGTNGAISLTVSGGTLPYSYNWSNSLGNIQNPTNLTAGTYTVTVTDFNNCEIIETITIIEPTTLSAIATPTDVTCFSGINGSVTLAPQGGTLPYSYNWNINGISTQNLSNISSGVYFVTITDANGCSFVTNAVVNEPTPISTNITVLNHVTCPGGNDAALDLSISGGGGQVYYFAWSNGATSEDLNNLVADTYQVTVSNNNGCTTVDSVTITEPDSIIITLNTLQNVNCFSEANGSISVSVAGGTLPYSYSWSNGATASTINNLVAGSYTLTVTDASGCVKVSSYNITQPQLLDVVASVSNVSCNGGSDGTATANVIGGTTSYSYFWSTIPAQVTSTATGLSAGNYQVIVTDANGCTDSVTVTVTEPQNAISATSSVTNVQCFGGSDGTATVFPTGGSGAYTYTWSTTPVQTTATALNLNKGIYLVTISDANNCTYVHSVVVEEPEIIEVYSTVDNPSCNSLCDGSINIDSITGGVGPFTILFSNNNASSFNNNLCPDIYNVLVQDANGCSYADTFEVVTPDTLDYDTQVLPPTCVGESDGTLNIIPVGGTGPWTILWNDGNTNLDRTGLVAGNYMFTVTDSKGCTIDGSVDLIELSNQVYITDATCFDKADGTILINAFGGYPPYSYSVNGQIQNSSEINGLLSGDYLIEVQDSRGCVIDTTIFIDEPAPLEVNVGDDTSIALGDSIQLGVSSNFGFFEVDWSIQIGDTSNPVRCDTCFTTFVRPFFTTIYEAKITTDRDCEATDEIIVEVNPMYRIFVANAFTPSTSISKNDYLYVQGDERMVADVLSFEVRYRGGAVIFSTTEMELNNWETGWNGQIPNTADKESFATDTYVWTASVRFLDGEVKTFSGETTLLR